MLEPMKIQDITDYLSAMDGILVLKPQPGDGTPEIAWGDLFFYYAPDGVVPKSQPFATIVTKNYPDDDTSRLDRPDAFRVNIAAGSALFQTWTADSLSGRDTDDVVIAHPVYSSQKWLAVVNPGPRTSTTVEELLVAAYQLARERFHRQLRSRHGGRGVG